MNKGEAIQRHNAAWQEENGEPWPWDDAKTARISSVAIRALMDSDKPMLVDPDLLLARKIVADNYERDECLNSAVAALAGKRDDWGLMIIALAGIRAGKAIR